MKEPKMDSTTCNGCGRNLEFDDANSIGNDFLCHDCWADLREGRFLWWLVGIFLVALFATMLLG